MQFIAKACLLRTSKLIFVFIAKLFNNQAPFPPQSVPQSHCSPSHQSIFFCLECELASPLDGSLTSQAFHLTLGVCKVFQELLRNAKPLSVDICVCNTYRVRCKNHLVGFPEQLRLHTVCLRSFMGAFTPVRLIKFGIISSDLCFTEI